MAKTPLKMFFNTKNFLRAIAAECLVTVLGSS